MPVPEKKTDIELHDDMLELESRGSLTKSGASSSLDVEDVIDPVAEKKLLKKLDAIMLPMFTIICKFSISYVFPAFQWFVSSVGLNFIDRTSVGESSELPTELAFTSFWQAMQKLQG